MRPPILPWERAYYAFFILLAALGLYLIGRAILRSIGRASPARMRHGTYVLGWMVAGQCLGGMIGVAMLDNNQNVPGEADVGLAGFGLLAGWAIGMTHGGVMLALSRRERPESAPPVARE